MREAFLAEKMNMKVSSLPVDLAGAQTGARINMLGVTRCTFVVAMGASAASTAVFTLQQHNAPSAGTSKVLQVTNPYFVKAGAATVFTKTEPTVASETITVTTQFSTASGLLIIEVLAEDLDVNNNFNYVSLNSTAAGVAKLGSITVITENKSAPGYLNAL